MVGKKSLGAIELLGDSIRAACELNILLIPVVAFALSIVALILTAIVALPFIILALVFGPADTAGAIALMTAGIALFIVLVFAASAIVGGFYFKSVDEYLKTRKFSIKKNIRFALRKWKKLLAVLLLQLLVGLAIMAVVFIPAIAASLPRLPEFLGAMVLAETASANAAILAAFLPLVLIFGLAFLVLGIITVFIRPLLFLWFPIAVFEELPAVECAKKGYVLGKAKYWRNFGALLLLLLVGGVLGGICSLDPTMVIGVVLSLWVELFSTILVVKVYRESFA